MRTDDSMTTFLHTVEPDLTLDAAYALMRAEDIRHLPVVSGHRLVGLLSERDILLLATPYEDQVLVPSIPVKAAMKTPVVTCRETTQLREVAAIMLDHKIDCLPVLDESGQLVGIITSSDLLEAWCGDHLVSTGRRASVRFKPVSTAAQIHPKRHVGR